MEFAVWIIAALLLVLLIFAYFALDDVSSIAKQIKHTRIWLEKVEKKLDDLEELLKQQIDEARNRRVR